MIELRYLTKRGADTRRFFDPEKRDVVYEAMHRLHKRGMEAEVFYNKEKIGGVEQDDDGRWNCWLWNGTLEQPEKKGGTIYAHSVKI